VISQFGMRPFGTTGPYSLPGKISVLGVLPSAENRFIVCWDVPPNSRDRKGTRSATNIRNYTITAIDPTVDGVVPKGAYVPTLQVGLWRAEVDEIDPTQIHVWTDRPMEERRTMNVVIDGPIDGELACEEFQGPIDWPFIAPSPPPLRIQNAARVRDLVDVHDGVVPGEEIESIWHYTASGDFAVQASTSALRKRVIRMLMNERGVFIYDPSFGVRQQIKGLMRDADIQLVVNSIRETLTADPAVAEAAVRADMSRAASGVITYLVAVRRPDNRTVVTAVPVEFSP
jgi:hypothetical protein